MYIFFLVIIFLGLALVVGVVAPRLPQAANLDIDNLPAEKEARKKREIILRRIELDGEKARAFWKKRLAPVQKFWGFVQLQFRRYVGKVERLWHHEQRAKKSQKQVVIPASNANASAEESLLTAATHELEQGNFERAEELFISVIKQNSKSRPAYRGLGDTYSAKGSVAEAVETYQFLLRLDPEDDSVMVKIADLAESVGDFDKAVLYYQQAAVVNDSLSPRFYHLAELLQKMNQPATAREAILQAVELEPKNPKYLDLMTIIGIECGDKVLAKQGFEELRMINPKNQKLADLQDRINRL